MRTARPLAASPDFFRGTLLCSLVLLGSQGGAHAASEIELSAGRAGPLDEHTWGPDGTGWSFGVDLRVGRTTWPWRFAIGAETFQSSTTLSLSPLFPGQSAEIRRYVNTLGVGAYRMWRVGFRIRPYLEGGVAAVQASVHVRALGNRFRSSDVQPGVYAKGGVAWRLGARLKIGLEAGGVGSNDPRLFGNGIPFPSSAAIPEGLFGTQPNGEHSGLPTYYPRIALTVGWGPAGD